MLEQVIDAYNEAVFDTDRERALRVVHDAVAGGVSPEDVLFKVVVPAMEMMMKHVSESFDVSLAQHFMTSQIASEVTDEMVALFKESPESRGRVVIGTAYGDMHSLGKRIVTGCLKSYMIRVKDLGLSVPAERFVDEALEFDAHVIAISAMMVHTARGEDGCLGVRRLLRERGLEDRIRIIVGGAPFRFDKGLYRAVQADSWAADGITAGAVVSSLVEEVGR